MKKLHCLVGLMFLLFCLGMAKTQAQGLPVIEWDTLTRAPKTQFPCDKPFVFKMPVKESPISIDLIECHRNLNGFETLKYQMDKNPNGISLPNIPTKNYWTVKEGKVLFLYIKFDYNPDNPKENNILKPNKKYDLFINQSSSYLKDLLVNLNKGDTHYVKQKLQEYKDLSINMNGDIEYNIPEYCSLLEFHEDSLKSDFAQKKEADEKVKAKRAIPTMPSDFLSNMDCICDKMKNLCFSNYFSMDDYKAYVKLSRDLFYPQNLDYVIQGLVIFSDSNAINMDATVAEKLQNLEASKALIQKFISTAQLIDLRKPTCFSVQDYGYLNSLIQEIETTSKNLEALLNINSVIDRKIKFSPLLVGPSPIPGNTINFDFEGRNKFLITPDFGLVAYGFQFKQNYWGITPYLGLHVNLTPIDKNIPFKFYPNKCLKHYFSLQLGWTLLKFAEPNKRTDFFSNSSLLTGVGFRVSQSFKVTSGVIWFYQDNPNPVISTKSLASTFYFGVSFDLDLKKYINNLTDFKF